MPSKEKVKQLTGLQANEARPFTVFYVNPETPEEVHTDTIMAQDCEDAQAMAGAKHMTKSILHVRGIGDNEPPCDDEAPAPVRRASNEQFPCARFIKGKFLTATFTDDTILESLSDLA